MIKLYHNPRCSKSRAAFALLEERGLEFSVKLYLEEPFERDVLRKALETLGDKMVRTGEADYKEHIKGKNLEGDALIDMMLQYPKTIERPLVINGDKMALGRPIEDIIAIL